MNPVTNLLSLPSQLFGMLSRSRAAPKTNQVRSHSDHASIQGRPPYARNATFRFLDTSRFSLTLLAPHKQGSLQLQGSIQKPPTTKKLLRAAHTPAGLPPSAPAYSAPDDVMQLLGQENQVEASHMPQAPLHPTTADQPTPPSDQPDEADPQDITMMPANCATNLSLEELLQVGHTGAFMERLLLSTSTANLCPFDINNARNAIMDFIANGTPIPALALGLSRLGFDTESKCLSVRIDHVRGEDATAKILTVRQLLQTLGLFPNVAKTPGNRTDITASHSESNVVIVRFVDRLSVLALILGLQPKHDEACNEAGIHPNFPPSMTFGADMVGVTSAFLLTSQQVTFRVTSKSPFFDEITKINDLGFEFDNIKKAAVARLLSQTISSALLPFVDDVERLKLFFRT